MLNLLSNHPQGYKIKMSMKGISIKDDLPKEGGRYLCYCESVGELGTSHFQWNCAYDPIEKTFSDFSYSFKDGERVTHWMPLPPPPPINHSSKP